MPAWQHSHTPLTLTSMRCPTRLGRVDRAAVVGGEDAGVVVEDVQAPERVDREPIMACTCAACATSTDTNAASPPLERMASTVARPASSTASATTTLAPSAANSSAPTRPSPPPAPVISATFPSSRDVVVGELLMRRAAYRPRVRPGPPHHDRVRWAGAAVRCGPGRGAPARERPSSRPGPARRTAPRPSSSRPARAAPRRRAPRRARPRRRSAPSR